MAPASQFNLISRLFLCDFYIDWLSREPFYQQIKIFLPNDEQNKERNNADDDQLNNGVLFFNQT